jgi:hypothetical protein
MNAIILKGAALRQPPLPQTGPRAKAIAHPCSMELFLRNKSHLSTYHIIYHLPLVIHDNGREN